MQAIILAAGMGKRLGNLTKDNTKCMIKVREKTLIERMINQLSAKKLKRIIIVIGYKGDKVRNLIGSEWNNISIQYIENTIYDKTNNIYSLYLAKDFLVEDDTLLLESDLIFSDEILSRVIDNPYPNLAVVARYQSWMDGTVVTLDEDNNILSFISQKAFNFSDIKTYYKTVNIYKFSRNFATNKYVPFLEAYCKALGNNEYYEQVLRVISLLDKSDLKALPLDTEKWYEIDDLQDLNNAEVLFSNEKQALSAYAGRYGGYWRFPHLLDFCYLVNPYYPSKRLRKEMKANFDILLSEYPSGMSVNAQLAARYSGVKPEQIVVGNGAAELIHHYCNLYPLKTGIILPTFEEYPNRFEEKQLICFTPQNQNFTYSANELIDFFTQHPIEQLILINPDNPSGNLLNPEELRTLIGWTRENGIRLLIDESFLDFAETDNQYSLFDVELLNSNQHLTVVKSISKSYGVPGLRLGFLASGDTELIKRLKKEISIWNINSFAEFYMQIFIKYQEDYRKACVNFREERIRFFNQLQTLSILRVIPSAANYFLCEVTGRLTAEELCNKLLIRNNILLKNCKNKAGFNQKEYIRIAIRDMKDNDCLVKALKEIEHE
ncbi:MAG: aminotransferase class I/II-fold pyridoxal phosphate-dependent enzyme [Massilibacteroides sp.]|nr:aminotransferase class I/II-fold pyridoxal phosphate-dependent enzyme [Massilibacteroides sp.]MDD3062595.1 aminotransferase class I/II-fold pyridoxal phosphate-dependent enzyme [Massilibacteroides sp.]MDD4116216.1 aminotransferase class I/II-fold pyridoxal phosphate-dependent enzyme [Massilibacteroides sp.]MDD4660138.1 aminotransferase class I/II-fold pyridoxal phosphate-dependent enzyme [Massilibacteroides sp.]